MPSLLVFPSYLLSLLFLILFISLSIASNGFGFGVSANGKKAVDFLIANKIQGPIYNNFDIGDYLAYRLYPQRIFVENRPEAYPADFFQQIYIPMQNNPEIFKKIDRQYRFNAIVISYWDNTPWGDKLLKYLINNSEFKLIYIDSYTIILLRDTPANKQLIARHLIKERSLKITNDPSSEMLVHYLFFFEKVGWTQNEIATLSRLQLRDPELCSVTHYSLEKTFIQQYVTYHKLYKNCFLVFHPET